MKAGRTQPSFSVSISENPRLLANSLPERQLGGAAPAVIEWVKLNKDELLRFWDEGETFSFRKVAAFVAALKRV